MRYFAFTLVTLAVLAGCGRPPQGATQESKETFHGLAISTPGGRTGFSTFTPLAASGSGSLVLGSPLTSADGHYQLSFALQAGGSLTLITNADDRLAGGVGMRFSRGLRENLTVHVLTGGGEWDVSAKFKSLSALGPLSVELDLHSGCLHFVAWMGGLKVTGLDIDGPGNGRRWGVILKDASLTRVTHRSNLREPHL